MWLWPLLIWKRYKSIIFSIHILWFWAELIIEPQKMICIKRVGQFGAFVITNDKLSLIPCDCQYQIYWIKLMLVFEGIFESGLEYSNQYILVYNINWSSICTFLFPDNLDIVQTSSWGLLFILSFHFNLRLDLD